MRLITRQKLSQFWETHKDAEDALKAWCKETEHAQWKTPSDIKARYGTADFLKNNRVVFNIKGNRYRLIVQIHYNTQVVYIRFAGTHKEYERINAEKI
ncbi:MAG: type II toxin-antitoxin system HigB family toxin [Anaerolineales bacterium]|nr:type II toxin-antitoxin system HigB family toxin [Anaerolineales bacterium]MDP2776020.1 type II toxin-antitoxin system HigB family toxin [Anaerolineales bacterium]